MSSPVSSSVNTSALGVVFSLSSFILWGLFPLYWSLLGEVSAAQLFVHRIVWAAVFLAVLLVVQGNWAWLRQLSKQPQYWGVLLASTILLSGNWFIYLWAVKTGRVVEASLGYFINPLVNVLLGRMFLAERLNRPQLAAVTLAGCGVAWLTYSAGTLPWIALSLAVTFGLYGLLRKKSPLASLEGLAVETFALFPLAVLALFWFEWRGESVFAHGTLTQSALLIGAGVITAIPLLLFAAGARRLTFATVGLLQYAGPTIQLALGVWLFNEPFSQARLLGFVVIWVALVLYTMASFGPGAAWLRKNSTRNCPS